jgi:ComF family protein
MKKSPPYARVIAYGLYEGVLKEAISRFKFYGLRRLSRPLGGLLPNLPIPEADAIVPVPLTAKGLRQRGFNQSLLIARVVSKKTGIPLNIDTLFKIKETPPQVGLSASERHKNLAGAFEVKGDLKGKRILLVDDVVTTGATAAACSKALLKAGAQEINVLTIARAGML